MQEERNIFDKYVITDEEAERCRIVSNINWTSEIPREISEALKNQLREGDIKIKYPLFQKAIELLKSDFSVKLLERKSPGYFDIRHNSQYGQIIYHAPYTFGNNALFALELRPISDKGLYDFAKKTGLLSHLL